MASLGLLVVYLPLNASAATNEFFAMDNAIRDVKRISDKAALLDELGSACLRFAPAVGCSIRW
ncbi:MAG: hypothetical protein OSB41_15965 [Kiritimatiellae bacterium]|nr:hypothetical protein [Kiritimatiellia bacterium]